MAQFAKEKWAGATVEFGLKDDAWQGFVRSKVSYFAPWKPGQADAAKGAADPKKSAAAGAAKGAAGAAKPTDPKKGTTAGAAKGAPSKVDF
jgi:hypothetical protein